MIYDGGKKKIYIYIQCNRKVTGFMIFNAYDFIYNIVFFSFAANSNVSVEKV